MKLADSPVTQHIFQGIPFFLKRDDLLHSHFTGNKARKLMSLLDYTDPAITRLVSYGSAQANSLYSFSALARIKKWQLDFYVDRVPTWLKNRPSGNYRGALELGANIIEMSQDSSMHPADYIQQNCLASDTLFIPEGGRSPIAESGVETLAQEILSWSHYNKDKPIVVALPSGTGATAVYLHKYLSRHNIEVLTCPCVGGGNYLTEQFNELYKDDHPTILELDNKHHFGKLYQADYELWKQLCDETNVEFDLLYDPLMWQCLIEWHKSNQNKHIMYIHQGGILGNESMLPRYQRKFDD